MKFAIFNRKTLFTCKIKYKSKIQNFLNIKDKYLFTNKLKTIKIIVKFPYLYIFLLKFLPCNKYYFIQTFI